MENLLSSGNSAKQFIWILSFDQYNNSEIFTIFSSYFTDKEMKLLTAKILPQSHKAGIWSSSKSNSSLFRAFTLIHYAAMQFLVASSDSKD
jgi:hypothetical protein